MCSGLSWLFRAFRSLCFEFWCFVSFDVFVIWGIMQKFLLVWGLEWVRLVPGFWVLLNLVLGFLLCALCLNALVWVSVIG